MSIRIKCGKTFGFMNDDMSINELMDYIVENCVSPGLCVKTVWKVKERLRG